MNVLFMLSVLLVAASVASVFYLIPVVSAYAFWFAVAGAILSWWAK